MPAEAPPVKPAPAPPTPASPTPSAKPMSEPPAAAPSSPPPDADPFLAQDAEIMGKFKAFEDKSTPQKTSDKPPEVKPEPKQPEKAAAPAPDKTKPVTKPEPKELRAELDRLKGELTTKNDAYGKMESKLKELESKGQDTTKLVERMSSLEKEIHNRDAIIRRLKKEESPEFKTQFRQPFDEAAEDARAVFTQLQVVTAKDEDTGQVQTRPANWDKDFSMLFSMDVATARREAKKMFPEDYDTVMGFYNDLWGKKRHMDRALRREQEQAAEMEKQEEAKRLQREEETRSIYQRVSGELSEKVEDYRDPVDDAELSSARQKGYEIFDSQPKTFQEAVVKQAHIRHRVAAFDPHRLQIARLKQQLAEVTKERDELKEPPTPGKTKRASGEDNGVKPEKPWEQEAREVLGSV